LSAEAFARPSPDTARAALPHPPAELRGRIGLGGAVFALVGYVIGGSIFILPGALAAEVGPAVALAYLIAALLALFVCFAAAQIGSAFPMSGGTYVAVCAAVSPFWGFMVVWMGVLIIFTSTPALAYGLVDYLTPWFPALAHHRLGGAIASIVVFTGINLLGIRTAVWVQALMVFTFMAVLLVVGAGGVLHARVENFRPLFPVGVGAVLQAAIPAFYSYSGFSAIVALGGEVERPRRNIPLVLAISFPTIVVAYTLVTLAVPGVVPWPELGHGGSTLSRVAGEFLPPAAGTFVAVAASCAIATTINGLVLSKSRDIFSLAVDRVLPGPLAGVGRFGEPRAALLFMAVVAVAGVLMGRSFTQYASMAVLCVMVVHVLQGVVVLVLPRRLPAHFESAAYRLGPASRRFWGAGLIVCACGFIVAGLMSDREGAVVYLAACGVGAAWYAVRRSALQRRGLRIEEMMLEHAAHVVRPSAAAGPPASPSRG
jgi:APA family basic amino acid/polyamine antiporter